MANVYLEARPNGRPQGSAIEGFVVEDHADSVLGSFTTQGEAIEWARKRGHRPLVACVRHFNDKKNPDHWRAVLRWGCEAEKARHHNETFRAAHLTA